MHAPAGPALQDHRPPGPAHPAHKMFSRPAGEGGASSAVERTERGMGAAPGQDSAGAGQGCSRGRPPPSGPVCLPMSKVPPLSRVASLSTWPCKACVTPGGHASAPATLLKRRLRRARRQQHPASPSYHRRQHRCCLQGWRAATRQPGHLASRLLNLNVASPSMRSTSVVWLAAVSRMTAPALNSTRRARFSDWRGGGCKGRGGCRPADKEG